METPDYSKIDDIGLSIDKKNNENVEWINNYNSLHHPDKEKLTVDYSKTVSYAVENIKNNISTIGIDVDEATIDKFKFNIGIAIQNLYSEILQGMIDGENVSPKVEALYRIADLNSVELDGLIDYDEGFMTDIKKNIISAFTRRGTDNDGLDIAKLDTPDKIKSYLVSQVMSANIEEELTLVEKASKYAPDNLASLINEVKGAVAKLGDMKQDIQNALKENLTGGDGVSIQTRATLKRMNL